MTDTQTTPTPRWTIALLVPAIGAAVAVAALIWSAQPWRDGAASLLGPFSLFMFGFAVLPHALVASALAFGRHRGKLWWTALVYSVLSTVGGVLMDVRILTSNSSTAALGYLFLPAYQLVGVLLAMLVVLLIACGAPPQRSHGPGA
ncbi:hypothetical protein [Pseudonocardia phyllosphaerae]|uniref:hypothetical protein n=1 Tax=Pseudonocardia phyllosphaerae TaxID=3390502 RepID=UPI003979983F